MHFTKRNTIAAAMLCATALPAWSASISGNPGPCSYGGGTSLGASGLLLTGTGWLRGSCLVDGGIQSFGTISTGALTPNVVNVTRVINGPVILGAGSRLELNTVSALSGDRLDVDPGLVPSSGRVVLGGTLLVGGAAQVQAGSPGSFIPLIRAGDMGSPGAVRRNSDATQTFSVGAMTFSAPSSVAGMTLAPEVIQITRPDLGGVLAPQLVGRWVQHAAGPGTPQVTPLLTSTAQANSFVRSLNGLALANLSNIVYSDAPAGYELLSTTRINDFKASAYRSSATNGGSIVIAVRGTDSLNNWVQNAGFLGLGADALIAPDAQALSAFAASVAAANSGINSEIVFTGHSRGGALASIVGRAVGAQTVVFNAPSIGNVLEATAGVLGASSGLLGGPKMGDTNLVNVTSYRELVANLPESLTGPAVGQRVVLLGDPLLYYTAHTERMPAPAALAVTALKLRYPLLETRLAGNAHRMGVHGAYLANPTDHPVIRVDQNGTIGALDFATADAAAARTWRERFFEVVTVGPRLSNGGERITGDHGFVVPRVLSASVVGGGFYFAETDLFSVLELRLQTASNSFGGLWLPQVGSVATDYEVMAFDGQKWDALGVFSSDDTVSFADASTYVRVRLTVVGGTVELGRSMPTYLALSFMQSGIVDIELLAVPVPEPGTAALLGMGFLIILGVRRAIPKTGRVTLG